jgi:acetyltransferase-like isoleucine patch superfamily enzyme
VNPVLLVRFVQSIVTTLRLKSDPVRYARGLGVRVGEGCDFISLAADTFGSEPYLVTIGSGVTLSGPVRFITHDGAVRVIRRDLPDIDVIAPIAIGDNAFVGPNTIILPGVTVGADSVVGAGSIVTKDVPPGTIVGGNPARVIRTVEEYRVKAASNGLHTKSLSRDAKRAFLEQHFSRIR